MVNTPLISIFIGCLLGLLAGLGIGGGTLLILWLTLVLEMEPGTARVINLIFFITAAGSVSLVRLRQKIIPWKTIVPAIAAGCLSAFIFSFLGQKMHADILKKMFGILLILTGIRELFYRPRDAR